MKAFIFAAILSTSLTSFANLTVEAKLDLTSTYSGYNAGLYQVTSELISFDSPVEANFSQSTYRDDNDLFCVSTIAFNVGAIKTTIKNLVTQASFSRMEPLVASASIKDETAECKTTLDSFAGNQDLHLNTTGHSYTLPIVAPGSYEEVRLWLTPFQTPSLKVNLTKGYRSLHLQAKDLFPQVILNDSRNKLTLFYYLQAFKSDSALSLAVGTTPLAVIK